MLDTILDDHLGETPLARRRALLPTWIKIFTWIFLFTGALVPILFVLGVLGYSANLALYGLQTNQPLSLLGLLLMAIFALKGATAFGLWTEKDWAVNVAKIDAIIGIVICVITMIIPLFLENSGFVFNLRFDLIPLALYLNKMSKISHEWIRRRAGA